MLKVYFRKLLLCGCYVGRGFMVDRVKNNIKIGGSREWIFVIIWWGEVNFFL